MVINALTLNFSPHFYKNCCEDKISSLKTTEKEESKINLSAQFLLCMNTLEMGLYTSKKKNSLLAQFQMTWMVKFIYCFLLSTNFNLQRVDLVCSLVTTHCICDTDYVQDLHRLIAFPDLHPPRYSLSEICQNKFLL